MIDFSKKKVLFSLEVFPPKDNYGLNAIYASMGRFRALNPDYISVTYGAGGSAIGNTAEIASDIQNKFGITAAAHMICISSSKAAVDNALLQLKEYGIKNILALRGDRRGEATSGDFTYASDLISYIKKSHDFEVSAACYPEGHTESPNLENDLRVMKIKADLGVSHFISQLFYDNDDFYNLLDGAARLGITTPIEAGIMPLTNPRQILRIISLSGAKIPPKLAKIVSRFEHSPEAFMSAGINYAAEQITDLL
ncbi:MAG: methylenetetrahydrofolate reductase, partial [Clostridia bacterium]